MRPSQRLRISLWLMQGRHVFVLVRHARAEAVMSVSMRGPVDVEQVKQRFSTWRHLYLADSSFKQDWAKLRRETQGA